MDPIAASASQSERKPRQLIVCCDGTNNNLTGGASDTNVVKLAQLLAGSPLDARQKLFYDPGVGNAAGLPGNTLVDKWNRVRARIAGLAFGRGVYENLAQCYQFLMCHYRPGDQIFIFGFSRGAFTARSLGGLVNQFGILRPHADSMVETLIHVYFSDRSSQAKIDAVAEQTSLLFADNTSRYVEIQFVGVWDTVASVGLWPFQERISAVPTIARKCFLNVRQALALDEHRAQFQPRLYSDNNGSYKTLAGNEATLCQLWFRGSHSDVGGGYAPGATGVSDQALAWIVSEAVQRGLRLRDGDVELNQEAAVLQAVARLQPPPPAAPASRYARLARALALCAKPAGAHPRVGDMLRRNCLWALTGMAVRSTTRVDIHRQRSRWVVPVEHASVAQSAMAFPDDTAWRTRRCLAAPILGAVLIALLATLIGWVQAPAVDFVPPAGSCTSLAGWTDWLPALAQYNLQFQCWQLAWMPDHQLEAGVRLFGSPRWALVLDLLLIALYAWWLAWFAVAAFAWRARLQRVGASTPVWLNLLGWALPLAVFSDVLENLASWLTLTAWQMDRHLLAGVAGAFMTLFSVAKFVGLAGTVALIVGQF